MRQSGQVIPTSPHCPYVATASSATRNPKQRRFNHTSMQQPNADKHHNGKSRSSFANKTTSPYIAQPRTAFRDKRDTTSDTTLTGSNETAVWHHRSQGKLEQMCPTNATPGEVPQCIWTTLNATQRYTRTQCRPNQTHNNALTQGNAQYAPKQLQSGMHRLCQQLCSDQSATVPESPNIDRMA
jgi:hypothetical protein